MIMLLRVYHDGLVIHAESYDHDEYPPALPPHLRCRCMPTPIWRTRELELTHSFTESKVTSTAIYPTTT